MADQHEVELSPEQLAEMHRTEIRQRAAPLLVHLALPTVGVRTDFNRLPFFRPGRYDATDNRRNKINFQAEQAQNIHERTPVHRVCGHIFQALGIKYDETMQEYLADLHTTYEELHEALGDTSVESEPRSSFNQAVTQLQDHMFDMVGSYQFETVINQAQHFGNFALAQSQMINDTLPPAPE